MTKSGPPSSGRVIGKALLIAGVLFLAAIALTVLPLGSGAGTRRAEHLTQSTKHNPSDDGEGGQRYPMRGSSAVVLALASDPLTAAIADGLAERLRSIPTIEQVSVVEIVGGALLPEGPLPDLIALLEVTSHVHDGGFFGSSDELTCHVSLGPVPFSSRVAEEGPFKEPRASWRVDLTSHFTGIESAARRRASLSGEVVETVGDDLDDFEWLTPETSSAPTFAAQGALALPAEFTGAEERLVFSGVRREGSLTLWSLVSKEPFRDVIRSGADALIRDGWTSVDRWNDVRGVATAKAFVRDRVHLHIGVLHSPSLVREDPDARETVGVLVWVPADGD